MNIEEHAKLQESKVRIVLEELASAMIELDTEHYNGTCTSMFIDYDEQDMLNAATILYHVCGNYAIKHGILTMENTEDKIVQFREMLKDTFGLDTVQEAQILCMIEDIKRFGGMA